VKTIWFNAWKYEQKEELWREFLMRILEDLKIEVTDISNLKNDENYSKFSDKILVLTKRLNEYLFGYKISKEDILNPNDLFFKLCDNNNPLSCELKKNFSKNFNDLLDLYELNIDLPFTKHQNSLVNELNHLIKRPILYNKELYKNVKLTKETRKLLEKKNLNWRELSRLNKQLLIEAYFDENLNQSIEDLQGSLYQDIDREEPFDIEFKPSKLVKGTIKLGIKSGFPVPMGGVFTDFFGKDDAFSELLDTVSVNKKHIHIKQIQLVEEFQRSFEKIIGEYYGKNNERVVIFIDDLDRCPLDKILEILQSINLFLDVKNCIFILGIDRRIVSKIIETKYGYLGITGDNYLEKIIQLGFNLPPISSDDMGNFVKRDVNELYKEYLDKIIAKNAIEMNPRKIKRLLNVIELQLNIDASIPDIQSEISESEETQDLYKLKKLMIVE